MGEDYLVLERFMQDIHPNREMFQFDLECIYAAEYTYPSGWKDEAHQKEVKKGWTEARRNLETATRVRKTQPRGSRKPIQRVEAVTRTLPEKVSWIERVKGWLKKVWFGTGNQG